jgi:hypothetical protein
MHMQFCFPLSEFKVCLISICSLLGLNTPMYHENEIVYFLKDEIISLSRFCGVGITTVFHAVLLHSSTYMVIFQQILRISIEFYLKLVETSEIELRHSESQKQPTPTCLGIKGLVVVESQKHNFACALCSVHI